MNREFNEDAHHRAGPAELAWRLLRALVLLALGSFTLLLLATTVLVAAPGLLDWVEDPAFQAWRTVLAAVVIQGLPFLLLGTVVSAAIGAFVPDRLLERLLPRNPALAVPVAGVAGAVLPGCECASVPVAGSLMRRGVAPAAALAFLLSAPAINPVVLVATSIAFPGRPEMVLARFTASLATSVAMGWLWLRLGRPEWLRPKPAPDHPVGGCRLEAFWRGLQHDFLHAGGFLALGAAAAATFNIAVPPPLLETFTGSPWLSVVVLAVLAVVLSICSEADAFVASSLSGFSPVAHLTFMVVGPMVDLKLIVLQSGTFGRAFAVRFSAATLAVAVLCSTLVGAWLL
ncbi:permease [Kitasatospora sp. NPDC085895]|uniref:permease n=1 Tax=Kitasatospora sp. NPDC085895 TaxID=3155057 RepID=UPI00344D6FA3